MKYQNGLHQLATKASFDAAASMLASEGWLIFRLSDRISNVEQFFESVRVVLPLDPPVKTNGHWDALTDSLWSGLFALGEERIAIVWPRANLLEGNDKKGFQMVETVFCDIVNTLSNSEYTDNKSVNLVILEGLG